MAGNAEFDEGTGGGVKGERKREAVAEEEERAQKVDLLKCEEERRCQSATMVDPRTHG